jgi:peptidoglycan/LPS O-acetylase OafA/YrhL
LLLEWNSPLYFLFGITTVALCAAWLVAAALFCKPQNLLRKLLRLPPLNYFGEISYGFYLWHFPICVVVADHVNAQHFGELKTFLITAVSTLLIASVSYHFLELPFLKLRHKFKTHTDTAVAVSTAPYPLGERGSLLEVVARRAESHAAGTAFNNRP